MEGKMSWDKIVERYPNKWVALADYERRGSVILSGVPVRICVEKDMYNIELELEKEGIDFMWVRTTELEGLTFYAGYKKIRI
jgi:hypothetical protein